ncbi:MAG TPA: ribonuclease PH, partial [Oceanicaulis sp.]|nr:ribonuclease PH [Oceanicaulis sp.]
TGGVIEVQASAEDAPMTQEQFDQIFALARKGVSDLCAAQLKALGQ